MNAKLVLSAVVVPVLFVTGCSGLSHTDNGALAGGGIGALTGAVIGGATGHAGAGALIGGGVGALAGAAVGHEEDKAEQRAVAAAQARAVTPQQVADMTHQNISDAVIINQIRASGTVYNLSSNDIMWMKQQGVSDAVISEMQMRSAYSYPQQVYVAEPVPPVAVGVGIRAHF